jgi:hypothetical protein
VIDRLAAFARSRGALVLIGAWAFGEAVLVPVVPDVVLIPLVAAAPATLRRLFLALLVGALAGSAILCLAVLIEPALVRSVLLALPGIDAATIAGVEADVAARGAVAFAQLGPGTPLKLDTAAWAAGGGSPLVLAGADVLNRVTRVGPGIVLAAVVGRWVPATLRRHERIALAAHVLFWIGLYLVYWRIV